MSRRTAVASGLQNLGVTLAGLGIAARVLAGPVKPPGSRGPGDNWMHMIGAGVASFLTGIYLERTEHGSAENLRGGGTVRPSGLPRPIPPARPPVGPDLRPVNGREPATLQGVARRVA